MRVVEPAIRQRDITLLEVLDRALSKGVVLWGDLTLSVADVDLVYVGLKVLLSSVETADRMRQVAVQAMGGPDDQPWSISTP